MTSAIAFSPNSAIPLSLVALRLDETVTHVARVTSFAAPRASSPWNAVTVRDTKPCKRSSNFLACARQCHKQASTAAAIPAGVRFPHSG